MIGSRVFLSLDVRQQEMNEMFEAGLELDGFEDDLDTGRTRHLGLGDQHDGVLGGSPFILARNGLGSGKALHVTRCVATASRVLV